MDYESYYMSEKEFCVLLAGKAVSRFYGFSSSVRANVAPEPLTTEEIYRILAGLYQKGYVSWKNDLVKLEGFASKMISLLKASDCCLQLTMKEREDPVLFYLSGGYVVMMEPSDTQERTFRITIFTLEELPEVLKDFEALPETESFYDEEEETQQVDLKGATELAVLRMIHPFEGRELGKIRLLMKGIDSFLEVSSYLGQGKIHYSPQHLLEQLDSLRKEEFR